MCQQTLSRSRFDEAPRAGLAEAVDYASASSAGELRRVNSRVTLARTAEIAEQLRACRAGASAAVNGRLQVEVPTRRQALARSDPTGIGLSISAWRSQLTIKGY